jgi:hypothetical protein
VARQQETNIGRLNAAMPDAIVTSLNGMEVHPLSRMIQAPHWA